MMKAFAFPPENLLPNDGEVLYYPQLFSFEESNVFLQQLLEEVPWKQEPIKIFGKEIMQPRLTAWYANNGITYSYSGITMPAVEWNDSLRVIKSRVEELSGIQFNSALLNLYRNGNDSMGWHRDNEKELGPTPDIASVSFGAVRKFQLRSYEEKNHLKSLELEPGSCLIMRGKTQSCWEHRVPKSVGITTPRLNITFRKVMNKNGY